MLIITRSPVVSSALLRWQWVKNVSAWLAAQIECFYVVPRTARRTTSPTLTIVRQSYRPFLSNSQRRTPTNSGAVDLQSDPARFAVRRSPFAVLLRPEDWKLRLSALKHLQGLVLGSHEALVGDVTVMCGEHLIPFILPTRYQNGSIRRCCMDLHGCGNVLGRSPTNGLWSSFLLPGGFWYILGWSPYVHTHPHGPYI